ncbi:MAG: DUF4112 domain-containing protein [Pseudomonadota bacterium]
MSTTFHTREEAASDDLRLDDAAFEEEHGDLVRLARFLDSQFRVPGTNMRFGADGLMGLVPVVGDVAGGAISLYLISKALRYGAPFSLVARMAANAGIDFAAGSIPLVGDLFDFVWKANKMNVDLLSDHLRKTSIDKRAATAKSIN